MLVRAELVRGDVNLLVEGEGGPLPLRQGEGEGARAHLQYSTIQYSTVQYSTGEGARAHVIVRLQREDEVLPRPSPHVHVGARLTRGHC